MNKMKEEIILMSIINGLIGSILSINNTNIDIKIEQKIVPSIIDDHLCYGCK